MDPNGLVMVTYDSTYRPTGPITFPPAINTALKRAAFWITLFSQGIPSTPRNFDHLYNNENSAENNDSCPVSDLDPLHSPETIGDRPDLEELTDEELLDWINNPNDGQGLTINSNGKITQGNLRAQELINRSKDPNSSITPDTRINIKPSPTRPNSDFFYDL